MSGARMRSVAFLLPVGLVAIVAYGLAALNWATLETREAQARQYVEARLNEAAGIDDAAASVAWQASAARGSGEGRAGVRRVYRAMVGDKKLCVLEAVSEKAYNGDIHFLVGLDESASGSKGVSVIRVRVVRHTETPGIGTRITDAAWLGELDGLLATPRAPREMRTTASGGAYAALTGATTSANALLRAVGDALAQARDGCGAMISQ